MLSTIIRFVFKLLMVVFAAVLGLGLLALALLMLALGLLSALFTGKKPAPLVVMRRFNGFSSSWQWPPAASPVARPAPHPLRADIVDVEVREISSDKRQP